MLKNKNIIIGITGGIAAYKAILLIRLLQKKGSIVRVVLTQSGKDMIGKGTLDALTQYPVATTENTSSGSWFEHIDLARWADAFVIAPCTANTIGVLANGPTPNVLSLIWMAFEGPKAIAPAMNTVMLNSPAVQKNIQFLSDNKVTIFQSDEGLMACGEVGLGRLPEPDRLLSSIEELFFVKPTKAPVILSAGRTEEPIDPVRYISNRASGRTALSLAKEFRKNGHPIQVVSGPVDIDWPSWVEVHTVKTSLQMQAKINELTVDDSILIMNAAVADYRPAKIFDQKVKSSRSLNTIELVANPDILKDFCSAKSEKQVAIGFAFETEKPLEYAFEKIKRKKCDLLVLNTPLDEFGNFKKDQIPFAIFNLNGNSPSEMNLGDREMIATKLYLEYKLLVQGHGAR